MFGWLISGGEVGGVVHIPNQLSLEKGLEFEDAPCSTWALGFKVLFLLACLQFHCLQFLHTLMFPDPLLPSLQPRYYLLNLPLRLHLILFLHPGS